MCVSEKSETLFRFLKCSRKVVTESLENKMAPETEPAGENSEVQKKNSEVQSLVSLL